MSDLSQSQLEQVWIQNGGNPTSAPMAAAIALAESGGNPLATNNNTNGSIDRGAWQINSVHGALSTTDLNSNAKAAISISQNGTDWAPWVTFQTGAYTKFLNGASSPGTASTPGTVSTTGGVFGTGIGPNVGPDLNPSDALTNVWNQFLGNAKYSALLAVVVIVGAYMIVKGLAPDAPGKVTRAAGRLAGAAA